MQAKKVYYTTSYLLCSTYLLAPAQAEPLYAGVYTRSIAGYNGKWLGKQNNGTFSTNALQAIGAYNNPLLRGVVLASNWLEVEPLPPGITFTKTGTGTISTAVINLATGVSGGSTSVTFSCYDTDGNYCWDTIDQQLDLIASSTLGASNGGAITLTSSSPFSLGIDINAGFHSPPWLSTLPISVSSAGNADHQSPLEPVFPSTLTGSGSFPALVIVRCADYGSNASCTPGQVFTSWIGYTGGDGSKPSTNCNMAKLPIPWSTTGGTLHVAPYAKAYDAMLAELKSHLVTYITNSHGTGSPLNTSDFGNTKFGNIGGFQNVLRYIKLGGALGGEDDEMTLLGGNDVGKNSFIYPSEASSEGTLASVSVTAACPQGYANYVPASGTGASNWLKLGYDPSQVENTFFTITDFAGRTFVGTKGSQSYTNTLLNLDFHSTEDSAFPRISFIPSGTGGTLTTYTAMTSADQKVYGPEIQDDIIMCGLGAAQPLNGTVYELSDGVAAQSGIGIVDTNAFYSGFFSSSGTLPTTCANKANPPYGVTESRYYPSYSFSSAGGTTILWGLQSNSLIPFVSNAPTTTVGTYAHAAAQGTALANGSSPVGGFILNWGTSNQGGASAPCTFNPDHTTNQFCTEASSSTDTTLLANFDMMLESGVYPLNLPTSTNQIYELFPPDTCNPYLWNAIVALNKKIRGTSSPLIGTYSNCAGTIGTFLALTK